MAETVTDMIIQLPSAMSAEYFASSEEFETLFASVKAAVDKHVPDTSTKEGRDAIKSLAHKVRGPRPP